MKFPIYRVEFSIYEAEDRDNPFVGCVQDVLFSEELTTETMYESLCNMVRNLGNMVSVGDIVAWDGFMVLNRHAEWCYHWDSHYTYQRFETEHEAMVSWLGYIKDHQDEVQPNTHDLWHMCHCQLCKLLNRTMMLHRGVDECPDCSYVS